MQANHRMQDTPHTGHTIPILHTTGQWIKFKDPVSTTQNYNTKDAPHILGIRDTALIAMVILDTGATGLLITTRYAKLSSLTTMGPSTKNITVADNTVINASHKTRLAYNLPPSEMEDEVVPTFHNYLIAVKPFADARCISIFHPHQGRVTIHHQNDVHIKYLTPPIIKELNPSPKTPHMMKA